MSIKPKAGDSFEDSTSSVEESSSRKRRVLGVRHDGDDSRASVAPARRSGLRSRFKPGGLKPTQTVSAPKQRGEASVVSTDMTPKQGGGSTDARTRASDSHTESAGRCCADQYDELAAPQDMDDVRGVRLSKLMAERGLCSRREADWIIERGWVLVDGKRVSELGIRFPPKVDIELAPEAARRQAERVTILLNKPVGYVSGQAEDGHEPAIVLIGPGNQFDCDSAQAFHRSHLRGLAPAGRLDIDSTGLLVLTQDGRVARSLIGDDSKVEKEYLVRVQGELDDDGLELLRHGLELDGRKLRPARIDRINDDQLKFVLREGRKRQIRRMCELVGLRVVGLKRVRIGKVMLGELPLGQWRFLRSDEAF